MRSQLERAINLAANTGDKIIVVDEFNSRSSVVMSLDEYEKLLNGQNKGSLGIKNLTEEELLDKINSDIVTWKDANSDKKFFDGIGEEDDDDFAVEDEENVPDFVAPNLADEEDLIPEKKEEPIVIKPSETKADEDENVYYYHEPESSSAKASEDESGFTSIKDELKKNKKSWTIPEEVKEKAEDVRI
jgi:hypothetical protein